MVFDVLKICGWETIMDVSQDSIYNQIWIKEENEKCNTKYHSEIYKTKGNMILWQITDGADYLDKLWKSGNLTRKKFIQRSYIFRYSPIHQYKN